jgi:hypothetical protein
LRRAVPKGREPQVRWSDALPRYSHQLAELLREDSAAQARCKEVVGINGDPFLDSQDVADNDGVGRITQKGQRYLADVYAVWSGEQRKKPDVTAEFTQKSDFGPPLSPLPSFRQEPTSYPAPGHASEIVWRREEVWTSRRRAGRAFHRGAHSSQCTPIDAKRCGPITHIIENMGVIHS